ncbi:MAG TPA: F-box protein [Waddliaceae bacterium]
MTTPSISGNSVREYCLPENFFACSQISIPKIVLIAPAILSIIGSIIAYTRAEMTLGHSLIASGGEVLVSVVLIYVSKAIMQCWIRSIGNEEQSERRRGDLPIPVHRGRAREGFPSPERWKRERDDSLIPVNPPARSNETYLYQERSVVSIPVDRSHYGTSILSSAYHKDIDDTILHFVDPISLCHLARTCKSLYAHINHPDSSLRLKIDATFKRFEFMRCLEMANEYYSDPSLSLPIVKSLLAKEAYNQIPVIDFDAVTGTSFNHTWFEDIGMSNLLQKFRELQSSYLLGRDSSHRWMFLIKIREESLRHQRVIDGVIVILQYHSEGFIWHTQVLGGLDVTIEQNTELLERCLEGNSYILSRRGVNCTKYSLWKSNPDFE